MNSYRDLVGIEAAAVASLQSGHRDFIRLEELDRRVSGSDPIAESFLSAKQNRGAHRCRKKKKKKGKHCSGWDVAPVQSLLSVSLACELGRNVSDIS